MAKAIVENFDNKLIFSMYLHKNDTFLSILQDKNLCYTVDSRRLTLLHYAVAYKNAFCVKHLISLGAKVDAQNYERVTPLIIAVKYQSKEIVKILLKANADLFVHEIYGDCALEKAYRLPKITASIRKALINKVTLQSFKNSQIWKRDFFHSLIPLYHFIPLKKVELTEFLLQNGSPVDAKDYKTRRTALHLAVKYLDVDNVRLLVENHADVNAKDVYGKRPLEFLKDNNDAGKTLDILKILVDAGATLIDYENSIILVETILSMGIKELLRIVLPNINLHFQDIRSMTPLYYLMNNTNPGVIEELENINFDVNMCNGKVPLLHRAAAKGNINAVKFLIKRRANVNLKDCYNLTPLFSAVEPLMGASSLSNECCRRNRIKCIEILLECGADPQILTKDNYKYRSDFYFNPMLGFVIELMKPILNHLALQEVNGQIIIEKFMRSVVEKCPEFETIFQANKRQLEQMKIIKIDESVNLFDFLIATKISGYASYEKRILNLTTEIKKYNSDSYYDRRLQERFLKLNQIIAINDIFVTYFNISVIDVAEKIIDYSYVL